MSEKKYIALYTPSGIGDIYWVLMKLGRTAVEQGIKFRIHTPPFNAPQASRSKFLEYLDCVESSKPDGIPYAELIKKAAAVYPYKQLEPVMYCECNSWLEAGNRVEHYMPDFPTEFVLNWHIDAEALQAAKKVLDPEKKNVVVYTSSVANNNSKSTGEVWKAEMWADRIAEIATPDVNLIWIGAGYDADILPLLPKVFSHTLIDLPAKTIISLLRLCDGFVSYQSGLSCITAAETLPTFMIYFRHIEKLSRCINAPDGNYEVAFFDQQPHFAEWVKSLPLRDVLGRGVKQKDYTFWVNENVEQTEKDWLENPKGHVEQFETISDLEGPILEIGCGSGCLAEHVKNPYTGIDQSEKLLSLARAKNPDKVFELGNIRELPLKFQADNVCAFGFMKHFALTEWDFIFAVLAGRAQKTLTLETPLSNTSEDWEEKGYDFPHTFVTDKRVRENAARNGFAVEQVFKNSAKEFTYRMIRKG